MKDSRITTTDGAVSLTVPASWDVRYAVEGLPLTAVEPGPTFRTNAVLTYAALPEGMSFEDWQQMNDQALPTALEDFLLLDLERLPVAGRDGARRLAHHASEEQESLTMEQWMTVAGSVGITLTLTCDTLRYPVLHELFHEIAGSLEIHAEPADPAPGAAGAQS